jgi:hypothetical protein
VNTNAETFAAELWVDSWLYRQHNFSNLVESDPFLPLPKALRNESAAFYGPYHPISISLTCRNEGKADSIDSGHGKSTCLSFESKIENQLMTVIGLYLSRYHLYIDNPDRKKELAWIKSKATR